MASSFDLMLDLRVHSLGAMLSCTAQTLKLTTFRLHHATDDAWHSMVICRDTYSKSTVARAQGIF
jgi:hypothetical protein